MRLLKLISSTTRLTLFSCIVCLCLHRCWAWQAATQPQASAPTTTSAQNNSAIFVANRKLGRGINLGNFLEVPKKENWGVPIRTEQLRLIKQAGFQSIRIPTKWSDYAQPDAPYAIDQQFAQKVDSFLDEAERVGLNVVLNIHHYNGLDKDPEAHTVRFAALWKQIAKRYKNRGEFLYFEVDNEPHEKLTERWNDTLLVGLAAIRETNATRPVIIGPAPWNGIWALTKLKLPLDSNLIVTVHMYNPHEFTHQGASWSNPEVRNIKDRPFGSPDEIAKVVAELERAAKWGQDNGRPIYVGEFGAYEKAPQASRIVWTRTIAQNCERLDMSWAYWEFAAGFGIYDLKSMQWRSDLLEALIPKTKTSQ